MDLRISRPTEQAKPIVNYKNMKKILTDGEIMAPEENIRDDKERSVYMYKQGGVKYVMKLGNHTSLGETTKFNLLKNEDRIYTHLLTGLKDEYTKYFPSIIDAGDSGKNFYYIIMEYIEGKTLSDYISDSIITPPPLNELLGILLNLTKGLEAMYSTGIVHGDLSAENIMIQDNGQIKIIDFEKASTKNNISVNIFGSRDKLDYTPPEYKRNTLNSNIEIIKKADHGLGYLFIVIKLLLPFEVQTKGLIMQILETILDCEDKCTNVYTECIKVIQDYKARLATGAGAGGSEITNSNTEPYPITPPNSQVPSEPSNSSNSRRSRRRKLRKRKTRKL